jgi:hypothetical protein
MTTTALDRIQALALALALALSACTEMLDASLDAAAIERIPRERVPGAWRVYDARPFLGVSLEGTRRDPIEVDALPVTTMTRVPTRAFSHPVVAPDGIVYLRGGGHGDYPGSDTMTLDLRGLGEESEGAPWVQEDRPHVPNGVENGYPIDVGYYCCGYGSMTVWYPGYPASTSTEPTPASWAPFGLHYASRTSWHPDHGFVFVQGVTLLGWVGGSPTLTPILDSSARTGLVSFDRETDRYTTIGGAGIATHEGVTHDHTRSAALSDYDDVHDALLLVTTRSTRSNVVELAGGAFRFVRSVEERLVGNLGEESGLMHYLGGGRHLVVDGGYGRRAPTYKIYDHGSGAVTHLAIPGEVDPDVWNLYFAPDREGGRLYALAVSADSTTTLYRTAIDAPGTWARLETTGPSPMRSLPSLGSGQKPLWFWNGSLYLFGGVRGGGSWGSVRVHAIDVE